ncbi:hypothetical protein [Leptolyngbya sp. FACHB-261]|uniref:hypothetical protein n=1 Tax=Leptolyngbya sp. FACHB-261 TaxID=2692806 RepID=UPI001685E8F5|nr:hypothetical protein [Leptolyngbya sp. FACHB-261]MBD2101267.1 hypothetical protein [Leptolyngbya sp. FACHB-261]
MARELPIDADYQPMERFPKPLDLAQVCVYELSISSAGLFLFLPFFNLLHPSCKYVL